MAVQVSEGANRDLRGARRLVAPIGAILFVLLAGPAIACIDVRDMRFSDEHLEEMDRRSAARLAEARENFGTDSELFIWRAESRISTLIYLDRYEEAVALATETLEIQPKESRSVRIGRRLLATETLEIQAKKSRPLHFVQQRIRDHLSLALLGLGRTEESLEVLWSIVEIGGMRSPDSYGHRCVRQLYRRLERFGHLGEAEALRREELGVIRRRAGKWSQPWEGDGHFEPSRLSELARLVEKQGRFDEARLLHAEAQLRAQQFFGDGPRGWGAVVAYARFLAEHGRRPEDAAALEALTARFPQLFRR